LNYSHRSLLPAALLLSLVACSEATTVTDQGRVTSRRSASVPATTSQDKSKNSSKDKSQDKSQGHKSQETARFIRFVDEGDGEGRLETAIGTYLGPQGQRVDLVAAVHVADRVYYQKLQKRFASYDALLYEMVKPKHVQPTRRNTQGQGLLSFFQRKLKSALDLEFQLDGISYMEPNFVHADLDVATFHKLSEDRGESIVALLLKSMAEHQRQQRKNKDKDGEDSEAAPPLGFAHLFAAFMSKDSSRLLKHLLARQLHQVEKALAGLSKGNGSVLLTERNKRCIEVLKERLAKGDKALGIFYGGAHMPDLEKRLSTELGFKKLEHRWLTAWDIKKKPTRRRGTSRPGK